MEEIHEYSEMSIKNSCEFHPLITCTSSTLINESVCPCDDHCLKYTGVAYEGFNITEAPHAHNQVKFFVKENDDAFASLQHKSTA